MISEIRSYLKSRIQAVDTDLKENKSAFYDNDIGETIIDRSFQIEINNYQTVLREAQYEAGLNAVISIFGRGYRDEIANYDELMDKAICISDNIIGIDKFTGNASLVNVVSNIEASQLNGNENSFKIDINLNLTIAYIRE